MTRVYYDFEFLETGSALHPISIGMVADDGREYYAIVRDHDTITAASWHDWLFDNVIPSLPVRYPVGRNNRGVWMWDDDHPDRDHVKRKPQIADEVRAFLQATPDLELFAWYAAFDHVSLAWLWGPMSDMPGGIPYWTNDLRQEVQRLGLTDSDLPAQPDGVHNALADARHNKVRHDWLINYEKENR